MESSRTDLYESIWETKLQKGEGSLTNRIRESFKEIDSGFKCLDVGCGDGLFGTLVRDRYRQVCGIDGSKRALKDAVSRGIQACLVDLDAGWLPFGDYVFDCISCLDVIEHVFDPEKLIEEISRILKRNGILILTTPNIRFIDFIRSLLFNGRFPRTSQDKGCYDGGHIHYFTFRDVRSLLVSSGFVIIKERGYDEKHYLSPKVLVFEIFMRFWERHLRKEFFCPGILFKAQKI